MKRAVTLIPLAALAAAGPAAGDATAGPPDRAAALERTLTLLEKPGTAERLARFSKAYYDALLERGFTQDQAIRILVGTGMPDCR